METTTISEVPNLDDDLTLVDTDLTGSEEESVALADELNQQDVSNCKEKSDTLPPANVISDDNNIDEIASQEFNNKTEASTLADPTDKSEDLTLTGLSKDTDDLSLAGLQAISSISGENLWASDPLFKDVTFDDIGSTSNKNTTKSSESTKQGLDHCSATDVCLSEGQIKGQSLETISDVVIKGSGNVMLSASNDAKPVVSVPVNDAKSIVSVPVNDDKPVVSVNNKPLVSVNGKPLVSVSVNDAKPLVSVSFKTTAETSPSMPQTFTVKPASKIVTVPQNPQIVYVKPPPGARVIYPKPPVQPQQLILPINSNTNNNQFIVSRNTLNTQHKPVMMQPFRFVAQTPGTVSGSNASPIVIPANTVLQSVSTSSGNGSGTIQTTKPQILIPASPSLLASKSNQNNFVFIPSPSPTTRKQPILMPASVNNNIIQFPNNTFVSSTLPNASLKANTVALQKTVVPVTSTRNPVVLVPSSVAQSNPVQSHTATLINDNDKSNILKPKPGQIVLQTADGQKLLLQPIEGIKPIENQQGNNLVFQQGKVNKVVSSKPTYITVNSAQNQTMVAYSAKSPLTTAKPSYSLLKSAVLDTSKTPPSGAIPNKDQLKAVPTTSTNTQPTQMTLKINVENEHGEIKHTIHKRVDIDTGNPAKKKSVLLDILTTDKNTCNNSDVDKDIEVLELNPQTSKYHTKHGKPVELGNKLATGVTKIAPKLNDVSMERTGIGGLSYFQKSSKHSTDMGCYLPLQSCGVETLEHLMDLTQQTEKNKSGIEKQITPETHKHANITSLLKNGVTGYPSKTFNINNNLNRRKQDLTNRNADIGLSIVRPREENLCLNKKPKRRTSPVKKVLHTSTPSFESDEVISSITDFDLATLSQEMAEAEQEHVDIMSNTPAIPSDGDGIKVKEEPVSPVPDHQYSFQFSPTNSGNDENHDPIRVKTEPGTDENESHNNVNSVYGQFYAQSSNSHQNVRLSEQTGKEFIPLSNFLKSGMSPFVKRKHYDNFDPDAPYDYKDVEGPISVDLNTNRKKIKSSMGLKDFHLRGVPDFKVIESRFAISGIRNVYSCNMCQGEYCTINLKSLVEHLEMHQKFPKLQQLVSERPYEVTALTGTEITNMVADSNAFDGFDINKCVLPTKSSAFDGTINRSNKRHHCTLCPYTARSVSTLQSHMNVHTMKSSRECDICHAVYRNSKIVEMHKTNEHKKPPYTKSQVVYVSARPL